MRQEAGNPERPRFRQRGCGVRLLPGELQKRRGPSDPERAPAPRLVPGHPPEPKGTGMSPSGRPPSAPAADSSHIQVAPPFHNDYLLLAGTESQVSRPHLMSGSDVPRHLAFHPMLNICHLKRS